MRYIIGIIIGIAIVFNWSGVKTLFESSIAKQGNDVAGAKASAPAALAEPLNSSKPQPDAVLPKDLNSAVEGRLKDIAAGR
jgi:hypothetical protein